jgi:hypothetical protein
LEAAASDRPTPQKYLADVRKPGEAKESRGGHGLRSQAKIRKDEHGD